MVTPIKIDHVGPYTIRAMPIGEAFQAQVFRGREIIGPRHDGVDGDAAVHAARNWLEFRELSERKEREATGAPSITAYVEAFKMVGLNRGEDAMIRAHLNAPWHKLTASELAKAAGWENWSAANLHYGGLGRKLAEVLDWMPPANQDGTPVWTMTIAVPANLDDIPNEEAVDYLMSSMETGGEFEWTLRPQVVAAFNDR